MNERQARMIAGTVGLAGVLLGAFGAHILRELLAKLGTAQFWQTAVFYHLVHAVVLLVLSGWRPIPRVAFLLIFAGITVFSGSLYLLSLTYAKWIGAITPLGGFFLLFGWLVLILSRKKETSE